MPSCSSKTRGGLQCSAIAPRPRDRFYCCRVVTSRANTAIRKTELWAGARASLMMCDVEFLDLLESVVRFQIAVLDSFLIRHDFVQNRID